MVAPGVVPGLAVCLLEAGGEAVEGTGFSQDLVPQGVLFNPILDLVFLGSRNL